MEERKEEGAMRVPALGEEAMRVPALEVAVKVEEEGAR